VTSIQAPPLTREEKERLLRAVEEDREFRYALMGLLGMRELLERFTKLEERQQRLEERFAKLEERFARLEEEQRETRRLVTVIAHRFGVISEEAFRQAMKFVVEDALGAGEVERWSHYDSEGFVYGYPSVVEVDVMVRNDGTHVLLEVKSRVSRGDVLELSRVGKLYEKVTGVKPKLVIIGGLIDRGVRELAKKLGVEVKPIVSEVSLLP